MGEMVKQFPITLALLIHFPIGVVIAIAEPNTKDVMPEDILLECEDFQNIAPPQQLGKLPVGFNPEAFGIEVQARLCGHVFVELQKCISGEMGTRI